MHPFKRLFVPITVLICILLIGVLGYMIIEKYSLLHSIYMVVALISTDGTKEIRPLSSAGKILTIIIIITGASTLAYTAGKGVELIMEGQVKGYQRKKVIEKIISELKNHYIICGFGRVGRQVAEDFTAEKLPFVVVDSRIELEEELCDTKIPFTIGDMTSDEILEKVGIKKAKGLIASADSDTVNVFVTLCAKGLNPDIYIVARSASADTEIKLRKAGANRVLTPYIIAGRRMAAMAQKPVTIDFLDTVMRSEHLRLAIREFRVPAGSELICKTLAETEIQQKSGATVLAIRSKDGSFNLQPVGSSRLEADDILVTIGTQEQLDILDRVICLKNQEPIP